MSIIGSSFMPEDKDELFICGKEIGGCGHSGTIGECKREWYKSDMESWMSLSGREGYIYKCPKCGDIVKTVWLKMS